MSTLNVPQKSYPFACVALGTIPARHRLLSMDGGRVTGEANIIHALSTKRNVAADGSRGQISVYTKLAATLSATLDVDEIIRILGQLDHHLTYRTFLVAHDISEADYVLWGCVKGHSKAAGLLKTGGFVHFVRWLSHLNSLDPFQRTVTMIRGAKADVLRANKSAAGFSLGLPNATQGAVVTRFPPEPSGYLHIGHAKTVMLNQYFAEMYNGRFLIRFDDTNPSKEKVEFEETILEDLRLLNAVGENVTHTSDYFGQLHDYAVQLIKSGNAYADDTDATTPLDHARDSTTEENLRIFSNMTRGTLGQDGARWCLRAKISVDDPNKALRDPVIYRCNSGSHHRTSDKWKVYPTYDFACPIVDSLEGYHWMIEALGLRHVEIWDFSHLADSTLYTVLSKRKLQQFVDKGLVRGWDDPRFPTVRGIMRRGLTTEALQLFMLQQGPSQAVLSLEWDSIWALNKKIIDLQAPRFWAILTANCVSVQVRNGPAEPYTKLLPKHKKNPEIGQKLTTYSSDLIIEQVDAASFHVGEEITLMDWGNAIVQNKTLTADGRVSTITVDLHLEGDFKATKRKITWLAQSSDRPLVEVTLLDYDYIITKKKLEEGDNWEDFITPETEFHDEALADANVLDLGAEKTIQFERKGFYRFDGDIGGRLQFIKIPDGKAAGLASKA
ncbi:tRNA synthetases class I, catalytic domain-containing protein [Mycena filopes]|nr:tRNA synthetases class I, catalytic domain-containing protein [Mycena filopes]